MTEHCPDDDTEMVFEYSTVSESIESPPDADNPFSGYGRFVCPTCQRVFVT